MLATTSIKGAGNQSAAFNSRKVTRILIAAGSKPEAKIEVEYENGEIHELTPLSLAAKEGKTATVKALIGAGANVNKADNKYGLTPLYWASENGHTEIVRILRAAGARR